MSYARAMAPPPRPIFLKVSVEGQPTVGFEITRTKTEIGSDPNCHLVLSDAAVEARHARLVWRGTRFAVIDLKSASGTWLNGMRLKHPYTAGDGDVLRIGPFSIEVLGSAPPRAYGESERAFLEAIERSPSDDEARQVYSDWLEEHGWPREAEFVRTQLALKSMTPDAPGFHALAARMRSLAPAMSLEWRRTIARPPIEKCEIRFELVCPKSWDALTPTHVPNQRFCDGCKQAVHYAPTVAHAQQLALAGHCVAVDIVQPRFPHDLDPPPMLIAGAIAPPDVPT
jgi:uncharacterized protein (TIGR02996 family)